MSAETKPQITRPAHFSECSTCPIAERIINTWQDVPQSAFYKSVHAESITINCEVKAGYVLLTESCVLRVLRRRDRKGKIEKRGTTIPQLVPCPHFINMQVRDDQKAEPE